MARAIDITLWYDALASEHGVIIETDDPNAVKQRLYAVRAESQDEDLKSISIVTSPTNPERDLWLVKRTADAPE
jgi:hypothetical protein